MVEGREAKDRECKRRLVADGGAHLLPCLNTWEKLYALYMGAWPNSSRPGGSCRRKVWASHG